MSDRTWGQVVTAIYVPNHISVNSAAIQASIANKLTKFKQPKHWIPLDNLPRNTQGKINRKQLLQIAMLIIKENSKNNKNT
jgi:O-succinylbenzoic acid--CoA ligase